LRQNRFSPAALAAGVFLDNTGAVVVEYKYDAWGKCKVLNPDGAENTDMSHIGNMNPFRYRSYYYDVNTGLYYLKSRFYDPETCRFLNADTIDYLEPDAVNGLNLYAYCGNNPIMNVDPSGHSFLATLAIMAAISLVTWGLGEVFGHQLIGGVGSISSGATAISTGVSLFAFGPVGWVIGGIAIIAGVASIAFGTAEIQEHFSGNNWIKETTGWSTGLYNGLYFASNIVASLASLGGNLYRKSKISSGLGQAPKKGDAYSRYYQMDGKAVRSITQYGKGGLPKYRIDVLGDPHFIKRLQEYALPHIHPFGNYNGYVFKKEVDTIIYWLWILRGNWR